MASPGEPGRSNQEELQLLAPFSFGWCGCGCGWRTNLFERRAQSWRTAVVGDDVDGENDVMRWVNTATHSPPHHRTGSCDKRSADLDGLG